MKPICWPITLSRDLIRSTQQSVKQFVHLAAFQRIDIELPVNPAVDDRLIFAAEPIDPDRISERRVGLLVVTLAFLDRLIVFDLLFDFLLKRCESVRLILAQLP